MDFQSNLPEGITVDVATMDTGWSAKFVIPFNLVVASLSASQTRIRQHIDSNAFFDEHKGVPLSVYGNLEVDITGIQHDYRFVPPDKLVVYCAIEKLDKYDITPTTCLKKCLYEMFKHIGSYVHSKTCAVEQQEISLSKMSYSRLLESLNQD